MSNKQETPEDLTRKCPVCAAKLGVEVLRFGETACPSCGHVVWFEKRVIGDVIVLDVLSGTVAINTDIDRVSKALLPEGGVPKVILNLANLKFISSAFVAGMIALQKRVRAAGGRLILCGMHAIVRETLHGARLDTFFDIHETEQESLHSF